MRTIWRSGLAMLSVAVILAACAAPPRAPAPIDRGGYGPSSSAGRSCGRTVTVQRGDTLSAIARQCDVPLSDIASENRLYHPYNLNVGQVLRVPGPPTYTVRRGDNLYRIALAHGMSTDEVAQLNGLTRPYTIYPGQELRVRGQARQTTAQRQPSQPARPPVSYQAPTPAPPRDVNQPAQVQLASAPSFQWPLYGSILNPYNPNGEARVDGIRIAARLGEPVRAAAPGEVVYAGNELQGYGELVLIRHADNWVTAYGLNSTLRVSVGQQVQAGHHIADAGQSGGVSRPTLHFEVRRGVNPVDPMQVLPAR